MTRKMWLWLLILVLGMMSFMGCSRVPPGSVGIKVFLLGKSKGVDHEVLGVGRYWIGPNEQLFLYPTFTQTYNWCKSEKEGAPDDESITFQTQEGLSVNGDFGLSYHIVPDSVPRVFQKYRRGIAEVTHVYLRNMVRDALVSTASNMQVEAIYGAGKVDLLNKAQAYVQVQCDPIGIQLEKLFIIGNLRLPPTVEAAINAKIQATQDAMTAENKVRQAEANAKIQVASAGGEAEANRLRASSITPQLIQWRQMEIEQQRIAKWNGVFPTTVVGGSGQGMNFLYQLGK